jgi:hypothetical protein
VLAVVVVVGTRVVVQVEGSHEVVVEAAHTPHRVKFCNNLGYVRVTGTYLYRICIP